MGKRRGRKRTLIGVTATNGSVTDMSHQSISDLAYALWQARGCPHGSAEIDWAEAERQVMNPRLAQAAREPDSKDGPLSSYVPDGLTRIPGVASS